MVVKFFYDVSTILELSSVKALMEKTTLETLGLKANIHQSLGIQWPNTKKSNYSEKFFTITKEIEQRYMLCRQFLK